MYHWKQTSPTRWERPLFAFERYFHVFESLANPDICNGRQQFTICAAIKLAEAADIEALRVAWLRLRWEQPQIACRVAGGNKVYDSEGVGKWAQDTCTSLDIGGIKDFSNIPASTLAHLFYIPTSRQIVFRLPHWGVDGRGAVMLCDAFMKALTADTVEMEWGSEGSRLSPCIIDVLGDRIADREESVKEMQGYLSTLPSVLGPPVGDKFGQCHTTTMRFSSNETSRIIATAKKHDWTVGGLVGAAHILAQRELSPNQVALAAAKDYWFVLNIDLRPSLPSPYDSGAHAANVFYWACMGSIPMPSTLADAARGYTDYLRAHRPDGAGAAELSGYETSANTLWDTIMSGAEIPTARDALYSSLGVINDYIHSAYGDYRVEDFFFSSDVTVGWCTLYTWTWDGQLNLAYTYNEKWSAEDVQRILDNIQTLFKGM